MKFFLKKVKYGFLRYNPLNKISLFNGKNDKQQLYIHIGMPKTGSSAIQAFLALNKSYLLKNKFSYPNHTGFKQAFQTSAGNVADMAKWIENENSHAINDLLNQTNTEHVILSSEILFVALKKYPEKFAKLLQGRNYKIICYIREFADLIESCINQQIKNHYRTNYTKIDNVITSFDYFHCLLEAIKYIDSDKIIVKKYANEFFYQGNIYADFMHTLGLELDDSVVYPEKVVNPSLNRDALEFRIMLNKSFYAKNDIDLKYRLNGILAKYSVDNTTQPYDVYSLLDLEVRDAMRLRFVKREKALIKKYFAGSGDKLFNSRIDNYKPYNGLSVEGLSKILLFIKKNDQGLYENLIKFIKSRLKNNGDQARLLKALHLIAE